MQPHSKLDVERIVQLIKVLPTDQYEFCLVGLVRQLVSVALAGEVLAEDVDREEAVGVYIRERLGHTCSRTYASELISMVRENDPDFDDWLFSGDHEEMLLVADSAL